MRVEDRALSPKNVVFATAEVAPWATSGGLGDVSGALPRALARLGHRVTIFAPLYRTVRERAVRLRPMAEISVPGFGSRLPVMAAESRPGEPNLLFLGHDDFFDRPGLYGDSFGDYTDNFERFAFFSRAVLEATVALGTSVDVIHANDWHTGLLGPYLRTLYSGHAHLAGARLVFTIHNLAYQGRFPADRFPASGLPWELFRYDLLEFHGQANLLKSGIAFADAITTVSPGYAAEILTPEYGEGLDAALRFRRGDLHGILNGIDVERWNPATDRHLTARYDADDLSGKRRCKIALLKEMGLSLAPEAPLVGMVSRLSWQKGCDLVLAVGAEVLRVGASGGPGVGLILLGAGEAGLEKGFRELRARHPDRVGVRIGFDETLAHRIEAGADIFLMPSRYEPCGLNQMYSLRYGTVPVVRACGGLADTVTDVSEDPAKGNGFRFREASGEALLGALRRAVALWENPDRWKAIVRRGMAEDHSWERSARLYSEVYDSD